MPRSSRSATPEMKADFASVVVAQHPEESATLNKPIPAAVAIVSSSSMILSEDDDVAERANVRVAAKRDCRFGYGAVKAASTGMGIVLGYTIGHVANSASFLTQTAASSLSGGAVGGLMTYFNNAETRSLKTLGKNVAYGAVSAFLTDLLVDASMTSSANLCYWMPPAVVAVGVGLVTEVAPKLCRRFSFFAANRASNKTEANQDAPSIPSAVAYATV